MVFETRFNGIALWPDVTEAIEKHRDKYDFGYASIHLHLAIIMQSFTAGEGDSLDKYSDMI